MVTCDNCSLQFSTERDFNVHIETCYRNKPPVECPSCSWKFGTVKELIAHKQKCQVFITRNILEQLYTSINAIWVAKQLPMITLPSTSWATSSDIHIRPLELLRALDSALMSSPFPVPLASEDRSKERFPRQQDNNTKIHRYTQTDNSLILSPPIHSTSPKDCFVQNSPRKQIVETDTARFHVARLSPKKFSRVSSSTISPPPRMFCSGIISKMDNNTQQQIPPLPIQSTSSKDCFVQMSRSRESIVETDTARFQVTKSEFSPKTSPQVSPLSSSPTFFRSSDADMTRMEKSRISQHPIQSTPSKDCSEQNQKSTSKRVVETDPTRHDVDRKLQSLHDYVNLKEISSGFSRKTPPPLSPLSPSSTFFRSSDADMTRMEQSRMPSSCTPPKSSKRSKRKSSKKQVVKTDTAKFYVPKPEFSPTPPPLLPLSPSSTVFRSSDADMTRIEKSRTSPHPIQSTPSKDCSEQKQKSTSKRVVETDTTKHDVDRKLQSLHDYVNLREISSGFSRVLPQVSLMSPSSSDFRSSDITPVEEPRERVSDSKVYYNRKIFSSKRSTPSKDCSERKSPRKQLGYFFKRERTKSQCTSSETMKCHFCKLPLNSLEACEDHLLQCPKRYAK